MKSFQPKGEDGDGRPGGRNTERNCRCERRKTIPMSAPRIEWPGRTTRAGPIGATLLLGLRLDGEPSRIGGKRWVDNGERHGGTGDVLFHARSRITQPGATLGGDLAYDVWRFKQALKERGIIPHRALNREFGWGGLPIPKPSGYGASQLSRKGIEEIFGWVKAIAGQAETKLRDRRRAASSFPWQWRLTIWSACPNC